MGTDNLFHKRKAKNRQALMRRKAQRSAYAKILIVCEGEKTEPNYFNGARDHYGLNTVNVEVRGDSGTDPLGIVRFARQRFREEKDAGDPFDEVYCVFDRDGHAHYSEALHKLSSITPKDTFFAINSVPCFEYWVLLHFTYTTKPYVSLPNQSAGELVLKELRDYLPDYQKGQRSLFTDLYDQLEFAKCNADRALQQCRSSNTDNPSTRIHQLVTVLQELKDG